MEYLGDKTTAATPVAKKPPVLSQYQLLAQKKSIAPPLYPTDVTIQKCKPISNSLHHMIDQLRASRLRIRNSPYYIDSQTPSAMDEKKDPLLSALGIKGDFFPSELVVKPSKKRLQVLYKKVATSEENTVQKLEKLFQQKDDFGEDIDEDETAENLFDEAEEEEEEDADADYTYAHFDDDEDYLDDDDFGGDGGDGKYFWIFLTFDIHLQQKDQPCNWN